MNTDEFVRQLVGHRPLARDLLARASAIAATLPEPTPRSEVAFAFGSDRRGFAAALVATWLRGHTAAVPHDASRHSVAPVLHRERNVAFLHDTGVGRGLYVPGFDGRAEVEDVLRPMPDETAPLLTSYEPETDEPARAFSVPNLLAEIDRTIRRLDVPPRAAGRGGQGALACPLPPMAWPSLLLGLLVPLRAGLSFSLESALRTEPALRELENPSIRIAVLPTTIVRSLATSNVAAPALERIVSSDGPVGREIAQAIEERFAATLDVWNECRVDAGSREAAELECGLLALDGVADAVVRRVTDAEGERWLAGVRLASGPDGLASAVDTARRVLGDEARCEVRAMARIPRDPSGRVHDADVHLAFGLGRDGSAVEHALDLALQDGDDDTARRTVTRIPERYAAYEGHFEGHPILAGAVQLERLVLASLRLAWPDVGDVVKLGRLKFAHRILPGDEVEVHLVREARERCTFQIQRGGTTCSSGVLTIESR